ncbi:Transposon Ty3-I Gag-Pol poly [Pelomyxa schiedti]|nr:Transposon Ty3-I Gag-Pol poly [Pelomyxa schiedti]
MDLTMGGLLWEECLVYPGIWKDTGVCDSANTQANCVQGTLARLETGHSEAEPSLTKFGNQVHRKIIKIPKTFPLTLESLINAHRVTSFHVLERLKAAHLCIRLSKCQFARRKLPSVPWVEAFDTLKHALMEAPILGYPEGSLPFCIESDASGIGLGAVLFQLIGKRRVTIAYWSQALTKAERNYDTRERECLAAVEALKHWWSYIQGAVGITLYTDHIALKYLLEAKNLSGRLARWSLTLLQYNPLIQHKPGKLVVVPHTLSHYPTSTCLLIKNEPMHSNMLRAQSLDVQSQCSCSQRVCLCILLNHALDSQLERGLNYVRVTLEKERLQQQQDRKY